MSKKPSTSSICSAVSEGSALDSNEPDLFGQLPSASESRSAKPSSESIGPTSRSTTTSEPSTQIDLEELTSSAAGSPASRGPLPGSSEAQKMTVTSGRSWLPLLKSYGLDWSLAKMSEVLLTSRWASSAAFLTWKASDTKSRHLLFQLAPSMPRTDETGSGLWRTPMAADGTHNHCLAPSVLNGKTTMTLTNQVQGVQGGLWPTPTTQEIEHSNMQHSSGSLNPMWVEWLMGFPTGWTDLKPSEMPSSRKSSNKSEKQSSQEKKHDV
jgi:hypothetical protein